MLLVDDLAAGGTKNLRHTPRGLVTLGKQAPQNQRLSIYEPRHEISNNVVCATSKASDQPAHTRILIIAFASRLNSL